MQGCTVACMSGCVRLEVEGEQWVQHAAHGISLFFPNLFLAFLLFFSSIMLS